MARFFDGIDDYAFFGSGNSITNLPGKALTYTFWINRELPSIVEDYPSYIMSKITPQLNLYGWSITCGELGSVAYKERMTGTDRVVQVAGLIPLKTWYFVAITVEPSPLVLSTSPGRISFYGSSPNEKLTLASSTVVTGGGLVRGDTTFGLRIAHFTEPGSQAQPYRGMFHGTLYDCRIYQSVLSFDDLSRIRCGLEITTDAAFNVMVLGSGKSESDVSGNGNSGQVFGALKVNNPAPPLCFGVQGPDGVPEPLPVSPAPASPSISSPVDGGSEHAALGADNGPISANFGSRSPTKYWPIRARSPGHRSRHGGRYH